MISITGYASDWTETGLKDNRNSLVVNWCGYQKLKTINLIRTRDHGRVDYQLIYLVNGKGYFEVNGLQREVSKGSIIVYSPLQPQYYSYFAKDGAELFWIHFTGSSAGSFLENAGLLANPILPVGISDKYVELFQDIIYELQIKKPNYMLMASAYFLELIASFGRRDCAADRNSSSSDDVIKRILAKIHIKYSESFSVSDLANECNLSLYHFIHKFKAETGMTPVEYITNTRINEAKKLLSGSSLNVTEVSAIVGYDNPLYFSRVFKKMTGISPSVYRK